MSRTSRPGVAALFVGAMLTLVPACNDTPTTPPPPSRVAAVKIEPAGPLDLDVKSSTPLAAVVLGPSGEKLEGRIVNWSSSAPSVAARDNSGNVLTGESGSAVVTATCEGKSASVEIHVRSHAPVAAVVIVAPRVVLAPGVSEVLTVSTLDADGNSTTPRPVAWSVTSHGAVALDAATATLRAIADGADTVSATVEGHTGTLALGVGGAARQMLDLGTLGGKNSAAADINAAGVVVGWSETRTGEVHAFRWTLADGMTDLGTIPGATSISANAVNDAGLMVGTAWFASEESAAVRWTPDGRIALVTGRSNGSGATSVNAPGAVAGWYGNTAAYWGADGAMKLLTVTPLYVWSRAAGINSSGAVAGGWMLPDDDMTTATFLATPDGSSSKTPLGEVHGLNDDGVVVGAVYERSSSVQSMQSQAATWSAAHGLTKLGVFPGDSGSTGYAINSLGTVVGSSTSAASANHAVIWTATGAMAEIGTLPGGTQSTAYAINDAGVVVGQSETGTAGGPQHAFLWNPAAAAAGARARGTRTHVTGARATGR